MKSFQNRIKVAHLTSVHSINDVRILQKECVTLYENGWDVSLVGQAKNDEILNGIHIKCIPFQEAKINRIIRSPILVYKRAIEINAEIYHFHDPELIFIGLILRIRGKKVIYDVHENFPKDILSKVWIPKFLRHIVSLLFNLIELLISRCFSAIITTDEIIAKRFQRVCKNVIVLHNYPILNDQLNNLVILPKKYESKFIVNFGGISKARCIEEIVDAINIVSDPAVQINIAGSCSDDELFKYLQFKPGWKYSSFEGFLSSNEILDKMIQASAAFILYSNLPNHYDIRSNRLFESLAAGLPVIVPNFSNWKLFINKYKCGICVDPHNSTEIAKAITYLTNNTDKAYEMGLNARNIALAEFNWNSQAPKLLGLYKNLNIK
jgi:glycosyltransferase involved in cell wall biosynthesis